MFQFIRVCLFVCACVRVCKCVCMYACIFVFVCECVCEREREREREGTYLHTHKNRTLILQQDRGTIYASPLFSFRKDVTTYLLHLAIHGNEDIGNASVINERYKIFLRSNK